jgi:hypothetical protein
MRRLSREDTVRCSIPLPKGVHKVARIEARKRGMSMAMLIAKMVSDTLPLPKTKSRQSA